MSNIYPTTLRRLSEPLQFKTCRHPCKDRFVETLRTTQRVESVSADNSRRLCPPVLAVPDAVDGREWSAGTDVGLRCCPATRCWTTPGRQGRWSALEATRLRWRWTLRPSQTPIAPGPRCRSSASSRPATWTLRRRTSSSGRPAGHLDVGRTGTSGTCTGTRCEICRSSSSTRLDYNSSCS